ncbi:MAG: hypothetical protein QNJ61_14515 [Desulfobacterales bacterium]|nr:hypothetical protein [Desulfobacterales bacterium]
MTKTIILLLAMTTTVPSVWAESLTIECTYSTFSDKDGRRELSEPFEVTFIIDPAKESVYVVGDRGSGKVDQVAGEGGLSFIEITDNGSVITTTFDSNGASVHSRNTTLNGILIPWQYYGRCIFK